MIRILFFAQLRESLGIQKIEVSTNQVLSLSELRALIIQENPQWKIELTKKNILMAINKEFSQLDDLVNPDDEVAFFPPVTGG